MRQSCTIRRTSDRLVCLIISEHRNKRVVNVNYKAQICKLKKTKLLFTENEGADEKKGEEDAEDHHEIMRRQEELIRKMVTEDDKNRDYWDEEYKSMNKWARYGIA